MSRPSTLGELRESGWQSRPIKDELRANAIAKIAAGEPLVDGILGYEDTVFPQLENSILAGHDLIFLGERGPDQVQGHGPAYDAAGGTVRSDGSPPHVP